MQVLNISYKVADSELYGGEGIRNVWVYYGRGVIFCLSGFEFFIISMLFYFKLVLFVVKTILYSIHGKKNSKFLLWKVAVVNKSTQNSIMNHPVPITFLTMTSTCPLVFPV